MNLEEMKAKQLSEVLHYMEIGHYPQAEVKLKQLLSDNPNNEQLLYLLALCYYSLEKYNDTLSYCTEAMANGYPEEDCFYLLGKTYLELKKYVDAEENFLNSLGINPQNAQVLASYGYLMFKTGHEKKASQLLLEALHLEPYHETVLHYNFLFHLAKDNRIGQQQTLKQYLHSANNEVNKLIKIGLADFFRQDYKSARENFYQAFLLEPTNNNILSLFKESKWRSNPFVFPLTWIEKIGGGAVLWLFFIVTGTVLLLLKLYPGVIIIVSCYLIICIYSWIVATVHRFSTGKNN